MQSIGIYSTQRAPRTRIKGNISCSKLQLYAQYILGQLRAACAIRTQKSNSQIKYAIQVPRNRYNTCSVDKEALEIYVQARTERWSFFQNDGMECLSPGSPSKSDPIYLWPLRHLIRVMRRHDLTKKKNKDKHCQSLFYFVPQKSHSQVGSDSQNPISVITW